MKLIVNEFDKLTTQEQEDVQDYISGLTPNFFIVEINNCDGCGQEKYLHRMSTDGGVIRICSECVLK